MKRYNCPTSQIMDIQSRSLIQATTISQGMSPGGGGSQGGGRLPKLDTDI